MQLPWNLSSEFRRVKAAQVLALLKCRVRGAAAGRLLLRYAIGGLVFNLDSPACARHRGEEAWNCWKSGGKKYSRGKEPRFSLAYSGITRELSWYGEKGVNNASCSLSFRAWLG